MYEQSPSPLPHISAWERIELARHLQRPQMMHFVTHLFDDFIELQGDRVAADDPALVGGIAQFNGQTVFVVGHEKGRTTDEKVRRNFGMAHPEGYRKALRLFRLAERFGYPILSFVDTPAAYPGIEAESRGQGMAIAQNLLELSRLNTPIFSVILSEGGSGGALGIAVADYIAMFEYAVYMICPPERCAEILWRDESQKAIAAEALKISAEDLLALGIVDTIIPEPAGGAHTDPAAAVVALRDEITTFLERSRQGAWTLARRRAKFRAMGQWLDHDSSNTT